MVQKKLKKEEEEAESDSEEFEQENLEEEIEETSEGEELEDFERFMSEGRIVEIAPKTSAVLENDMPIEDLEVDLSTNVKTRGRTDEEESQIKYIHPTEDEDKKYIISEERKMRPRTELREDFDFASTGIAREDGLRRVAPEDNFLNRELESGRTDFKGDYDIEKDYVPGETGELKIKRKMPWER